MKRSAPTALLLGLLLVVPLVFAVGGVRRWSVPGDEEGDWEMVPPLSLTERRSLLTFEQRCTRPEDCEAPLGCLGGFKDGAALCLDSECTTDLQCEESFSCQAVPTLDRRRFIRTCVPAGKRKEGEACWMGISKLASACERGLRCDLFCGRPCLPGVSMTCSEGSFCREGPRGPSCQPTCPERGCPAGQECVRMGADRSLCAVVLGTNCQKTPCPEGTECSEKMPELRDGGMEVGMECIQRCGQGRPPCPEDSFCWHGVCRQHCDPETPDPCGPGQDCIAVAHEKKGFCRLR